MACRTDGDDDTPVRVGSKKQKALAGEETAMSSPGEKQLEFSSAGRHWQEAWDAAGNLPPRDSPSRLCHEAWSMPSGGDAYCMTCKMYARRASSGPRSRPSSYTKNTT